MQFKKIFVEPAKTDEIDVMKMVKLFSLTDRLIVAERVLIMDQLQSYLPAISLDLLQMAESIDNK